MRTLGRGIIAFALLATVTIVIPVAASARQEHAAVCQEKPDGTMRVVRVAPAAAAQHARRGGTQPGDDLGSGYIAGEDCSPTPAPDPEPTPVSIPAPVPVDIDGDGVADVDDNCPTIANADQTNTYGSSAGDACEDSNHNGTPDATETDICLSKNGAMILQRGSAVCATGPSTTGGNNVAMAHGVSSRATATAGGGNTATADGNGAVAVAQLGIGNTAVAQGAGSSASAQVGDANSAAAIGAYSGAFAGNGNHNIASATGACAAIATGGDNLTAECTR